MKLLLLLACISVPAMAGSSPKSKRACNVQAKGLKGKERKAFLKKCLGKTAGEKGAAPGTAAATLPPNP